MATVTYDELLASSVVTRAISQFKTPQSRFTDFLGARSGGPNSNPVGGHHASWDIFDKTRTLAKGRAPGAGAATTAPQVIGHVDSVIYRSHEKIPILDERVFRRRPIGGQWGEVDTQGQRYITAQEGYLAQRFANVREFMIAKMLAGGRFDMLRSGDDWVPVEYGSGNYTVDFQVAAAGNTGECLMTNVAGTAIIPAAHSANFKLIDQATATNKWSDTANAPIIAQVMMLNRCFEIQHGWPVRHCWVNSSTVQWMLNNTGLKNAAGQNNTVFSDWRESPYVNVEGIPDTGHEIVFRGLPFLRVHVYDGVLNINGTETILIPDSTAIFTADPSPDWFEMLEGSELVRENDMAPPTEHFGLYAWTKPFTDPSGREMFCVDNCLPALYVPRCIVYATVNW